MDKIKEIKYELYLVKREMLELKKKQKNLVIELKNLEGEKTLKRKK